MVKHKGVLECKQRLAKSLLEVNVLYVPEVDPIPRVSRSKNPDIDVWIISVGGYTQVLSQTRASQCMEMIRAYDKEVQEVRKRIRPPKVNGPALVIENDTPFTDLQKEIDKGMGGVGIVLAFVGFILVCIVMALLKLYA